MKKTEEINNQLKSIYETYLNELKTLSAQQADNFSCPLLMHAFDDYFSVKHKVLYVGKETYGWLGTMENSKELTVDILTDTYTDFEFAKYYPGRNSPFWRFIKTFHNKLNGEDFANGFLWTNFSKCDSNGTTPNYNLQKLNDKGFELILDEIKIIKPDIVIFITGWDYEHQFQRVFNGLQYETLEENFLYKCIHSALPTHSYMTMHPQGLQFKNKFNSVRDKILEIVS